jgi:hypothetical protein
MTLVPLGESNGVLLFNTVRWKSVLGARSRAGANDIVRDPAGHGTRSTSIGLLAILATI